jgi:branched-chain amino acid transport system permease protein
MVVMVVIGGFGTVLGPVVGAIAIAFVSEWLRRNYTEAHTFILGGLIIIAVVLLPQGISTYVRDGIKTRQFSLLDNVRRYRL